MISKTLICWLTAAAILTGTYLTIYTNSQQTIRSGANDPQIQLAEDAAGTLDHGLQPDYSNSSVDVERSLAPFLIIYGNDRRVVHSEARLGSDTPALPAGVFDVTASAHESRFTWQPDPSVRIAAVVVRSSGGYVLAGRSMREIESREGQLLIRTGLGLLGSLTVLTLGIIFYLKLSYLTRGK